MSGTEAQRSRPRRLGRGLSSLVGDSVSVSIPGEASPGEAEPAREETVADRPTDMPADEAVGGLRRITIDLIDPSPFQPRESFDDSALDRLADSIRRSGVMQPIVARPAPDGRFELVAGERRLRAARRAGLGAIPAVVRDLSDEQSAELCLVENVQREDLNPIERANAFAMLARRFSLTHAEVGERVGLERSSVSNFVRLLELDDELRSLVADGALSLGHAKALLGVPAGDERTSLGRRAVGEGWSVRRLEREAASIAGRTRAPSAEKPARSSNLDELERQLAEHLGTRVRIRADSKGHRGRVEIAFYDLDHFDGLMSRLGFKMR